MNLVKTRRLFNGSPRLCTGCKISKDLVEFRVRLDRARCGKRSYYCRSCESEMAKKWANANRDRIKVADRKRSLKKAYGLSIADFDNMFDRQNGCCAICKKPEREQRKISVDHNHTTGRVRGLLCGQCNRRLGVLEKNSEFFRLAAEYLETYQ